MIYFKLAVFPLIVTEVTTLFTERTKMYQSSLDEYAFGQEDSEEVNYEKEFEPKRNTLFDLCVIVFGALVFIYIVAKYLHWHYVDQLVVPMIVVGVVAFVSFFLKGNKD